jgi:hypothetical protein
MDTIRLNRSAHQKPSISVPGIIESAIKMITALITSKNNPRVNMVKGIVRRMSRGFSVIFSNASRAARIKAYPKFSICTPGNR